VADLDHLETTAIAVLSRAHEDDHHANRLLYKICQEIKHPALTPTVSSLSTGYFYVDTKMNLMFIPPVEASFLLHLPDLYHEICHPLLTHRDDPVLDRFRVRYLECMVHVHDYFGDRRDKQTMRRGPREFTEQINLWEVLWTKYWLPEFFCDLYGALTLGPVYAWSHLHLYVKKGSDAFALPDGVRNMTHPADDARMRAILLALRQSGFDTDASAIARRWEEALQLTADVSVPDYMHCYPDALIDFMVGTAATGVAEMECRLARPATSDPIHTLLNQAWHTFWVDPVGYQAWERNAVQDLIAFCEGKVAELSGRS
jgi:hypothetical protein